ncbi:hypothetical protein D9M68_602020 [compost metagenome]
MKRYITQNTRATASSRVISTFWMEISTNVDVSYGMSQVTPGGKYWASSCIVARMRLVVSTAFEPGASLMPSPVPVMPFTRDRYI